MALNNMGLGFIFTTRDLASAKIDQLSRRFQSLDDRVGLGANRMTGAFARIQAGAAAFVATAGALGGVWALTSAAGRFEQQLAAIGAVTKATTQEMEMLRNVAIEAGLKTQFSPQEAVEGLTTLATAGQTATQATQTLLPVLDLAAGSLGQLGVAQAAEAVVGTLNAYGLSADNAAMVTDKLLRLTQLTNFQTRDFEGGLAKAAASGAVFKQSLDDALITLGLLRNRNIDASSSATAYRESVRRVGGELRAQKAVMGAGVDIFDKQSGQMRSIVDIMVDFAEATKDMTDQERNRRITVAFGARGLLAFNAVMNASFTEVKNGVETTYKGAEAIEAMRVQMAQASGTAVDFRTKLLDTFEGQKTLLIGTLQTFAVALGEPLIKVLKPVVAWILDITIGLLEAFQALPDPIKKIGAVVVLAGVAFIGLVLGVIALTAAMVALKAMFAAVGAALALIKAFALPVLLVLGLLIATVAAFKIAFDKNLGGLGAFATGVWEKISLAFQGIKQLFESGAFSGAVRTELNKAGNTGLKQFLINIYKFVYRIGQIWEGFKQGFTDSVVALSPVFQAFGAALRDLLFELGESASGLGQGLGNLSSDKFRSVGRVFAEVLALGVRWVLRFLSVMVRLAAGIVSGFRTVLAYLQPALDTLVGALGEVSAAWQTLVGDTQDSTQAANNSTESWKTLGTFLGLVFGGIVQTVILAISGMIRIIGFAIRVVAALRDAFVIAGEWISETAASIGFWFTETLPTSIGNGIRIIANFFGALADFFIGIGQWFIGLFERISQAIVSFFTPVIEFFQGVARAIAEVMNFIRDTAIEILREIPDELLPEELENIKRMPLSTERPDPGALTLGVAAKLPSSHTMPAVAEAQNQHDTFAALETRLQTLSAQPKQQQQPQQPLLIQLQVDGETIAEAAHKGGKNVSARSYAPLPLY